MFASNYFEEQMLNLMRGRSITAPANVFLGLLLSNPQDDASGLNEVSYSGYQRQIITFTEPGTAANGLSMQNDAEIIFPESPIVTQDVSYVGIFDPSGNMLTYSRLETNLRIQAGVSPVFREGQITLTWSGNMGPYYRRAVMNTLRGQNVSAFSPFIALCNGDPTGSGNEFSGNGYARIPVVMSAPEQQVSGAALTQNMDDIISNIATGSWGTLNTIAIMDAATGGNAYAVIAIDSSFVVNTTYSVGFKAGQIQYNIN